ncbi:TSC22 domain family protein 1-like [Limulus polyphemus]|uniref:TSC22 domain family protein 1-like n=1 Tax=Limulus polyphemus TaxID=6850 RepID=A0ABM1AZT9_LIMPO|nr:TSC22 domain family protein 1-like [Limulus polyphemus]
MLNVMSTVVQFSLVDNSQQVETVKEQMPHLNLSDETLLSVYYFIREFIGSSTGSSTVAIDSKIEQAMDLVKSHLMFAVREEVDVLKEKIGELLEKISQLEYENGILKANASQETLSKLSQPGSNVTSKSHHALTSSVGVTPHQQASLPVHPQHQSSST